MNKEEITKEDILNVTGSMFDTMFDYVDNSNKELEQLRQENKQLKDNWNKLKEYMIKEQARIVIENTDEDEFVYTELLIKIQELEDK